MDFITSKAMIIAVGVFVTVIITSSVFVILGYVLDIYGNVSKIDYAYLMQFDEYNKYHNVTLSGVEALNMCNKFKNDKKVTVLNEKNEKINADAYFNKSKLGTTENKYIYSNESLKSEYVTTVNKDEATGNINIILKKVT